jgi:enterochelin esterase-like enzyme
MLKKIMMLCVTVLIGIQLSACTKTPSEKKFWYAEKIPSPSLEGNLLDDPAQQELIVLLPPSYNTTQKKYPVVYFLHGYSGSPESILSYRERLFNEMKEGSIREFIIVAVNGHNSLMGSFYVNSPVTGKWEDSVIVDVVPYIDNKYRTIASADSRGIMGFSMGGFGAINLSFRHPETFSAVFAVGPGLFDRKGLRNALSSGQWDLSFMQAYGAAFAPNTNAKKPFADIPDNSSSQSNKVIVEKWENGFGNLEIKIKEYLSKKDKLGSIRIAYGRGDMYAWIPDGCRYFSRLLKDNKIAHELTAFEGGHMLTDDMMIEDVAPFFSKNLRDSSAQSQ